MSNVRKYLQDAQTSANRNFANFNGNGNQYKNFTGPTNFAFADGGQNNGMGAQMAPQSSPYAIQISNSTGNTISGFQIFGGWTFLSTGAAITWTAGSGVPTNSGVTISGVFSNATYQYLLNQSVNNPFSIGATQIVSTVNNAQVNQPMTVSTTDSNGDSISKVVSWLINPFQNQGGTLINYTQYRIDGSTLMTMTILPDAVFSLYFFPMMNNDLARPLVGSPIAQQFGNPNLQPANTVVIPSAGGTTVVNRLRS